MPYHVQCVANLFKNGYAVLVLVIHYKYSVYAHRICSDEHICMLTSSISRTCFCWWCSTCFLDGTSLKQMLHCTSSWVNILIALPVYTSYKSLTWIGVQTHGSAQTKQNETHWKIEACGSSPYRWMCSLRPALVENSEWQCLHRYSYNSNKRNKCTSVQHAARHGTVALNTAGVVRNSALQCRKNQQKRGPTMFTSAAQFANPTWNTGTWPRELTRISIAFCCKYGNGNSDLSFDSPLITN